MAETLIKSGKKCLRAKRGNAIADYLTQHSDELSDNTKKWIYNNVSEAVNLQVFGRRANKLCEELKANRSELREAMTPDELLLIQEVENVAMRLIDACDIHPLQAVKDAALRLLIPIQTRQTPLS